MFLLSRQQMAIKVPVSAAHQEQVRTQDRHSLGFSFSEHSSKETEQMDCFLYPPIPIIPYVSCYLPSLVNYLLLTVTLRQFNYNILRFFLIPNLKSRMQINAFLSAIMSLLVFYFNHPVLHMHPRENMHTGVLTHNMIYCHLTRDIKCNLRLMFY